MVHEVSVSNFGLEIQNLVQRGTTIRAKVLHDPRNTE